MYPKISDLINAVFGTHINLPIMSYGFFVALAFLVGAYLLYLEFIRKENEGLIKTTTKKIMIGKPASVGELLVFSLLLRLSRPLLITSILPMTRSSFYFPAKALYG